MVERSHSAFLCCAVLVLSCAAVTASCSDDGAVAEGWTVEEGDGGSTDFGDDSIVIVRPGAADDDVVIISGDGEGCVELDDGSCVDPAEAKDEYCGEDAAQADIILNDEGEVIDVICYPPNDDGTDIEEVQRDDEGNAEVPQTQGGAVITFNEDTDGEPIEGDVTLTAENVSLFGNGVDTTIIDGNLTYSSNNAQARGITVTGDVTFDLVSNQSNLAFCKIEGNLTVRANEVTVANCQVFGDVLVSGNGGKLVNIGVQGGWDVNPGTYCDGCYSFSDENGDLSVAADERGDDLACDAVENNLPDGNNAAGTNNRPGGTNNAPGPNNLPGM